LSLIEDEEGARRLARAIMSDVTLYNDARIARAIDPERDLATELEEARQLFQARVAPRFYMVFEDAVRRWAADARARAPQRSAVEAAVEDQAHRRAEVVASTERTRTAMTFALVVILIAVIGATVAFVAHEHHDTPGKHEGHR